MNKLWQLLAVSLVSGLALAAISLLVMPKITVFVGPSCPVCEDVNGGRYYHTERGWPLRFFTHQESPGFSDNSTTVTLYQLPQLAGDALIYTAISFGVLTVTRRRLR